MTEWREQAGQRVPLSLVSFDTGQTYRRSGEGGISPHVHFAEGCACS